MLGWSWNYRQLQIAFLPSVSPFCSSSQGRKGFPNDLKGSKKISLCTFSLCWQTKAKCNPMVKNRKQFGSKGQVEIIHRDTGKALTAALGLPCKGTSGSLGILCSPPDRLGVALLCCLEREDLGAPPFTCPLPSNSAASFFFFYFSFNLASYANCPKGQLQNKASTFYSRKTFTELLLLRGCHTASSALAMVSPVQSMLLPALEFINIKP